MEKMKIVFMGTPEFAVASLDILVRHNYDIVGVITATDKPSGRGLKMRSSPVKNYAVDKGLKVLQPKNLKAPEFLEALKSLRADLQVVVAFRMLPQVVWDMPPLGSINLHASLLPQYRGAAPINWAIMNGETQTGLTTFFIRQEIDTGQMIYREAVSIGEDETAGELHDRLMVKGAELVLKTVDAIASNNYPQVDQPATEALKKAPKLFKEDCRIDWSKTTREVYNHIRGLSPFPGAWTNLEGKQLKIFRAGPEQGRTGMEAGRWITDQRSWLKVATADGAILIHELQLEGKRKMTTEEFLRGYTVPAG